MDKIRIRKLISSLAKRDYRRMYMNDFFLTWEKTDDEIAATFLVAEILRGLREANISCRMFDSGLGISLFRDNSTRTRFSFASACNLLGLEVQDLDEGKSQIAHGETVRETANMISFMADVIGIRDDMYIGKGNAYMHTVSAWLIRCTSSTTESEGPKGKKTPRRVGSFASYGKLPLRAAGRHRLMTVSDGRSGWRILEGGPYGGRGGFARCRNRRFVQETNTWLKLAGAHCTP